MEKENLFGKNLRWLRERNNFTQAQLANALNLDRSSYSYYELGQSMPNVASLKKIKRIYNVSLDDLLTEDFAENLEQKGKVLHDLDDKREKQLLIYFRSFGRENREKSLSYMKELARLEKLDARKRKKKPSTE